MGYKSAVRRETVSVHSLLIWCTLQSEQPRRPLVEGCSEPRPRAAARPFMERGGVHYEPPTTHRATMT